MDAAVAGRWAQRPEVWAEVGKGRAADTWRPGCKLPAPAYQAVPHHSHDLKGTPVVHCSEGWGGNRQL